LAQRAIDRTDPGAAALLLDENGLITESAAANILLVRDGTVVTPSLESILPGISLQVVRELCAELNLTFREADLTLKDCTSAQEAFLTNTSFCMAGIRRINRFELPWPGPITRNLLDAWSRRVGVDIPGQFLAAM
jgi:branched-subunit amino acid aminotransferase/4-amino-4-deoxychorismate lyase